MLLFPAGTVIYQGGAMDVSTMQQSLNQANLVLSPASEDAKTKTSRGQEANRTSLRVQTLLAPNLSIDRTYLSQGSASEMGQISGHKSPHKSPGTPDQRHGENFNRLTPGLRGGRTSAVSFMGGDLPEQGQNNRRFSDIACLSTNSSDVADEANASTIRRPTVSYEGQSFRLQLPSVPFSDSRRVSTTSSDGVKEVGEGANDSYARRPTVFYGEQQTLPRQFSNVSMVSTASFCTERSRQGVSPPLLFSTQYETEEWRESDPTYPALFSLHVSSKVRVPHVRRPGESDEEHQKCERFDYEINSYTFPTQPYEGPYVKRGEIFAVATRSLSNAEINATKIEDKIREENAQRLAAAFAERVEEMPSTSDPTTIVDLEALKIEARLKLSCGRNNPAIAIAAAQGRRGGGMEDNYAEGQIEIPNQTVKYVALFDGHGDGGSGALGDASRQITAINHGASAAEFCAKNMPSCIRKRLMLETLNSNNSCMLPMIRDALSIGFVDLSNSYVYENNGMRRKGGSTAVAAFMIGDRLWMANVGDSRAMLVGPHGEQIPLTEDAHPNKERFYREVIARGGNVNETTNRLEGGLAIARTIGDHQVRGVSARADVTFVDCPDGGWKGWYLVQTCDGINEKNSSGETVAVSSREMGDIVYRGVAADKELLDIAEEILMKAYVRGSTDNLTVIITPVASLQN